MNRELLMLVDAISREKSVIVQEIGAAEDTPDDLVEPVRGGELLRQAAADGRLHGLDRTHRKTGCADALKIHVAAEIVTSRPQRRQRRHQPRLQFDKAADRGRRALLHRQPHAFELGRPARALHGDDAQHKTVGALANVAGFAPSPPAPLPRSTGGEGRREIGRAHV